MSQDNIDNEFSDDLKRELRALRNTSVKKCPDADILNTFINKKLDASAYNQIERHLDLCADCLQAAKALQTVSTQNTTDSVKFPNWRQIEEAVDGKVCSAINFQQMQETQSVAQNGQFEKVRDFLKSLMLPPKLAFGAAFLFLGVVLIYSTAYFSRPEHFLLAEIQYQTSGPVRTQAGQENDLTHGLLAFELKNYPQSISLLRAYLKTDAGHYLANFELGLAYLFSAKKNLFGLSYGFAHERVEQGIHYLKIAQATAADNPYYQEECLWYLAKAHLMAGKAALAKKNLQKLFALAQPDSDKKQTAQDLLLKLEK